MSVDTLVSRFTVSSAWNDVAAYLGDPTNYRTLNPFVIEVRNIRPGGATVEFEAVERIRMFGGLHRNNLLRLAVRCEMPDKQVIYDVTSPGGIAVRITTKLVETGSGTDVEDTIMLTVPRLVRRFAVRNARAAQHHKMQVLRGLA